MGSRRSRRPEVFLVNHFVRFRPFTLVGSVLFLACSGQVEGVEQSLSDPNVTIGTSGSSAISGAGSGTPSTGGAGGDATNAATGGSAGASSTGGSGGNVNTGASGGGGVATGTAGMGSDASLGT